MTKEWTIQSETIEADSSQLVSELFTLRPPYAPAFRSDMPIHEIFTAISVNPNLLVHLPQFLQFGNQSADNENALTSWLSTIGITNKQVLHQQLTESEIKRVLSFDPRVEEILFDTDHGGLDGNGFLIYEEDTSILTLAKVLDAVHNVYTERALSKGMLKEARSLIARFLPDALPQEPTQVIFVNANEGVDYGGEYVGRTEGIHYIFIKIIQELGDTRPLDHISGYSHLRHVLTLVHESIHQKHSEFFPDFVASLNLDLVDTDAQPGTWRFVKNLKEGKFTTSQTGKTNLLVHEIVEGIAVLGADYVTYRCLQDWQSSGDFDKAKTAKDYLRHSFSAIKNNPNIPHGRGVSLIRVLYDTYGPKRIFDIIKAIDVEACSQTTEEDYHQIHTNPLLLPGLEKFNN